MLNIKKEAENLFKQGNTEDEDIRIEERMKVFVKLLMLDTKGCDLL